MTIRGLAFISFLGVVAFSGLQVFAMGGGRSIVVPVPVRRPSPTPTHAATSAPVPSPAPAPPNLSPITTNVLDYLIQKVCVVNGVVQSIDPYNCPAGGSLQSLSAGQPMPYHKHDQPNPSGGYPNGYQQHDSYPVIDAKGVEHVLNPFDYAYPSYEQFSPYKGDGYDYYSYQSGWASGGETSDGNGFMTTFFGSGCTPYNGWVFFPASSLTSSGVSSGSTKMAIAGNYWEHNGEPWPGNCPSGYDSSSLTSWSLLPQFSFSGIGGAPVKHLDTIQSIHGYESSSQFQSGGHLEVFYFTYLYGITRWEVWTPVAQNPTADSTSCTGETSMNYQGNSFVRVACRDWSAVSLPEAPELPPAWPVPGLNLLKNFHFDSGGIAPWNRIGSSTDGAVINWSLYQSKSATDINESQVGSSGGVRYLATNCDGTCTGLEMIYQDIPVSSFTSGQQYVFGVNVRSESGSGIFSVSLEYVNASGAQVGSVIGSAAEEVNTNFTTPLWSTKPTDSVVLSSQFVSGVATISPPPGAASVRFIMQPQSSNTFDMVDAWLMHR